MKKYLLDTNIYIYFLKGQFNLYQKTKKAGVENCFVSEITIAKLKYGVENSSQNSKNRETLEKFQNQFIILPIYNTLNIYAKEKARLKLKGKILDDFDLLIVIDATAIANNLTMVTRNISDFERLEKIELKDWTSE
ncbi:PIN domain-containing protein [Hydrotalea sp.]|uniref:PIN domain-containing protein n=1 Tax=Hydrotalea sp. TaxID=2881279 RepID=UPI0026198F2E|nr:PIN domain-containing protein [Hydrotalea sp.]